MSVSSFLEPVLRRVQFRKHVPRTPLRSFLSEVSLLSDRDIEKLIKADLLNIKPYNPDSLNPSSIDLCLGSVLTIYTPQMITLGKSSPEAIDIEIGSSGYILKPGEFILATTKEEVCIPNGYQGVIETKGNVARAGVQVHSNDGHIDPGFSGHITLEIWNLHPSRVTLKLIPGTPVCQLFIGKLSSACNSPYHGKYLNQVKPTVHYP